MVETYQEFIRKIEDTIASELNTDSRVSDDELNDAFSGISVYQRERTPQQNFQNILQQSAPVYQSKESTLPTYQPYHIPVNNKRRLFLHVSSYLPSHIRGMTDTLENIWINYNDYEQDLVLNHELLHVLHPEWSELSIREFHETYIVDRSRFELIRN